MWSAPMQSLAGDQLARVAPDGSDLGELLTNANTALYVAMDTGRDRVVAHTTTNRYAQARPRHRHGGPFSAAFGD